MAHTCPECGQVCHCGGDIDDICFGIAARFCCHCIEDDEEDNWEDIDDYEEDEFERDDNDSNDSRNL